MRVRHVAAAGTVSALVIAVGLLGASQVGLSGQTTDSQADASIRTPWGEPDLQGIWTTEVDTPFERPERFGDREFLTPEEQAALDEQRAGLLSRNRRVERGTELDVAGAYNAVFLSYKPTDRRTSLIVDPPNGRVPRLTPEALALADEDRAFRVELLRSTETCRSGSVACRGGAYNPEPSPRRSEMQPPLSNTGRMNRQDNIEDGSLGDRCLSGGIPEFGTAYGSSFRRIVQTPGGISIFYDVGQGQGFQRNIVMNGSPHLPDHIRQWWGDSRGHWDGDTLVIDVTNFSPQRAFRGSRENLHLVERWTRTGPDALDYEGHDRRPDGVGPAVDRPTGIPEAERSAEPHLLRTPVLRGQLRLSGAAAWGSDRGGRVRRRPRPASRDVRQRHRFRRRRKRPASLE